MKNILKSKTIWFNVLSALIYFLTKVQNIDLNPDDITAGVIAGNTLLRLVTHKGLQLEKDEPTK